MTLQNDFTQMGSFLEFVKRHKGLSPERFAFRYQDPFLLVDFHKKVSRDGPRFKTTVYDCTLKGGEFGSSLSEATSESTVVILRKRMSTFPGMITIGRTQNNDIILEYPTISKLHACFLRGPDTEWYVQDLGSKNGTVVNRTLLGEHSKKVLTDGDSIFLGPDVQAFFFQAAGLAEYMSIFAKYHEL